jgi:hypothetical protein
MIMDHRTIAARALCQALVVADGASASAAMDCHMDESLTINQLPIPIRSNAPIAGVVITIARKTRMVKKVCGITEVKQPPRGRR